MKPKRITLKTKQNRGIISYKQLKRFVHNLQYNPNINDETDVVIVSADEEKQGLPVSFLATLREGHFENYTPDKSDFISDKEVVAIGIDEWPERYTIKINP